MYTEWGLPGEELLTDTEPICGDGEARWGSRGLSQRTPLEGRGMSHPAAQAAGGKGGAREAGGCCVGRIPCISPNK